MGRNRVWGRRLILLGVSVWAPYFAGEVIFDLDPPLLPFLAVHLAGVIPGAVLSRWDWIARLLGKWHDLSR